MSHSEYSPLKQMFMDRNLPVSHARSLLEINYRNEIHENLVAMRSKLETLPSGSYDAYNLTKSCVQGPIDALEDDILLNVNMSPLMDRLKPQNTPRLASDWQAKVEFAPSSEVTIHMARHAQGNSVDKNYKIHLGIITYEVNKKITPMEISDFTDLIYLTGTIANDL